jgi:hypothetical protein
MRRTATFVFALALLALLVGLGCNPPPVEQRVETVVGLEDVTAFSLPELTSQNIVGTVNVTQQGTAMRIRVSSSPDYRLSDVRVCVMPESARVECMYWMGPENIGTSGREFAVDLDNLQSQICTTRYRILLRYRIVSLTS